MNFEDMMWLFNTDRTRGISRVNIDEAALLWRYAKGTVLEIGTRKGGTTALLLATGCRVITIDLKLEIDEKVKGLWGAYECMGYLVPIVGDSKDVVLTEELDTLFIDGDHSYKGCLVDTERYWHLLKVGGHAIFHDAAPNMSPGHCEGVASVVKELLLEGRAKSLETVRSMVALEKLGV